MCIHELFFKFFHCFVLFYVRQHVVVLVPLLWRRKLDVKNSLSLSYIYNCYVCFQDGEGSFVLTFEESTEVAVEANTSTAGQNGEAINETL